MIIDKYNEKPASINLNLWITYFYRYHNWQNVALNRLNRTFKSSLKYNGNCLLLTIIPFLNKRYFYFCVRRIIIMYYIMYMEMSSHTHREKAKSNISTQWTTFLCPISTKVCCSSRIKKTYFFLCFYNPTIPCSVDIPYR